MQFSSLYSPAEIVSGISAAEDAGLSVEQGVICFVMLSAAIEAELQKRGGILQRAEDETDTETRGTSEYAFNDVQLFMREAPGRSNARPGSIPLVREGVQRKPRLRTR